MNYALPAAVAALAGATIAGRMIGSRVGYPGIGTAVGAVAGLFLANAVGESLSPPAEKTDAPALTDDPMVNPVKESNDIKVTVMPGASPKLGKAIKTIVEVTPEVTTDNAAQRSTPFLVTGTGSFVPATPRRTESRNESDYIFNPRVLRPR